MISLSDRRRVRELAARVADAAGASRPEALRAEWRRHNSMAHGRPMVLIFPEGAWREMITRGDLTCEDERVRGIEHDLLRRLYVHERLADTDNVIEAEWTVHRSLASSGWGVEAHRRPSPDALGAWAFEPVIHTADDLEKITAPRVVEQPDRTRAMLWEADELLGDILDVRLRGVSHVSFHLMSQYTALRGLEQAMMDMHGEPEMVHQAMAILEAAHQRLMQQYEEQGLLSLNNDHTYHSSGGLGYIDTLPAPGYQPDRVRPADMWASAEAQELAQVSPKMHREFALTYERRLLAPFGLNGYGCCEDLTRKLDDVLEIPNLRRISVAPSADMSACAARIGRHCILSWKPDPTFLATDFDPEAVRTYLRAGIRAASNCQLEIILKDTHTCGGVPERFETWARIAREELDRASA